MRKHLWVHLLNTAFWLLPIVLIVYVYFGVGVHLPPTDANADIYSHNNQTTMASWKSLRTFSLYFYALALFCVRVVEQKKKIKIPFSSKAWLIGFLLTIFSYAIGGALVDLSYLHWFIQQGVAMRL